MLVLTLLIVPITALASPYIVVDEPALKGAIILIADLYNRGETTCLVAQGSSIYLVENGTKTEIINNISGQISAMAVGDLTGDLKNNLIVGTANAGALYVYQEQNGHWVRVGQPLYMWDTIQKLEVHDFNNDGWGDLLILTGQKEAQILLSWEGKLYPFWKTGSDQRVIDWQVVDVNQDGFDDLIYIVQSGYIGILTWDDQEFVSLWENYPWGQMESLIVLPQQRSPEWIAVTSQKMLYGWRWQDGEVVLSRHFHAADLGESIFHVPGQGLLSFSKKTGASLFELKSGSISENWRVPGVFATKAFYHDGTYFFSDAALNHYRLVPGNGQWRIFVNNEEITDLVQTREYNGQLYYNLQELGSVLGFTVISGGDWHFLKDGHYLTIEPGTDYVKTAGLKIPITGSIHSWEGAPYVTGDLLPIMGWSIELDRARQQIWLYPNWGWWLPEDK